jgi:hypothetical protein
MLLCYYATMLLCSYTHILIYSYTHILICIYSFQLRAGGGSQPPPPPRVRTRARSCASVPGQGGAAAAHLLTHTNTHTHTHTLTHTRTHTHTQVEQLRHIYSVSRSQGNGAATQLLMPFIETAQLWTLTFDTSHLLDFHEQLLFKRPVAVKKIQPLTVHPGRYVYTHTAYSIQ